MPLYLRSPNRGPSCRRCTALGGRHLGLTIGVDYDTGQLEWAAPGRDRRCRNVSGTLDESRCAVITHVSADAGQWLGYEVAAHGPITVRSTDPFNIVPWAGNALDHARGDTWNAARKGRPDDGSLLLTCTPAT